MKYTEKRILDGGKVRMLWNDRELRLEELPRKPCKKSLRCYSFSSWYAVQTLGIDRCILQNILAFDAVIADSDTYEQARDKFEAFVATVEDAHDEVRICHAVYHREDVQHFTKVRPEGKDDIQVQLKDTTLRVGWTKFECWSPGSTMSYEADGQPHYSMIQSTSEGMARKLYKMVEQPAVRAELAKLGWGGDLGIWDWLRQHNITFDVHHSTW